MGVREPLMVKTLTEKIESLPPDKRARVEDLVDRLTGERDGEPPHRPDHVMERIRAQRERLLREHGLFDSAEILRELREEGP